MSVSIVRALLVASVGCAFIGCLTPLPALAQSTGSQSAAKQGGVEGDPNGSIRSLGAAGYNEREAKAPAVTIPPLDEGPSGTSGPPLGTLPARGAWCLLCRAEARLFSIRRVAGPRRRFSYVRRGGVRFRS